ncbi:unnamed protein product [Lampetra fluviatilis]
MTRTLPMASLAVVNTMKAASATTCQGSRGLKVDAARVDEEVEEEEEVRPDKSRGEEEGGHGTDGWRDATSMRDIGKSVSGGDTETLRH